jgi:hypothetical protein
MSRSRLIWKGRQRGLHLDRTGPEQRVLCLLDPILVGLDHREVAVDQLVQHLVGDLGTTSFEQRRAEVDPLAHSVEREQVAVADRDDESLRHEDRHLLHVHPARLADRGGVGDHEHVALVALHLGTLVARQRVRERQPVQPELISQLRHLALVRRVHIDPYQRVRPLQHVGDLRERQRVVLAHALAVHNRW